MASIEEIKQANFDHFMERGPGLSYGYTSYVIARRPSSGEILLGGLGGLGVGQMWFAEGADHVNYPGYAEAEILP